MYCVLVATDDSAQVSLSRWWNVLAGSSKNSEVIVKRGPVQILDWVALF